MRLFCSILLFSCFLLTNSVFGATWNNVAPKSVRTVEDTSQFIKRCLPNLSSIQMVTMAPPGGTWSASCGNCIDAQGLFDPTALTPGKYLVTYAQSASTDTILVSIFSQPLITASANKDSFNCGQTVKLTATNGQNYQWSATIPANLLSCNPCENPTYTADSTRNFTVIGTDANGCSNSASVKVPVRPMLEVILPNAFTPNGDQTNDIFRPTCRDNVFKDYHLSIYSRWGERVFETVMPGEGWNGKIGDQPASSDVYVYVLEYEFIVNGEPKKKFGEVSLIR